MALASFVAMGRRAVSVRSARGATIAGAMIGMGIATTGPMARRATAIMMTIAMRTLIKPKMNLFDLSLAPGPT
jgi:hypothetical protein